MNGLVLELLREAMASSGDEYHVFFRYSPHVQGVYVHAQRAGSGYHKEFPPARLLDYAIYLDYDNATEQLESAIEAVRGLRRVAA